MDQTERGERDMKCEILCVGTELLLGDTVNTNAAYLARELAALGVNVYYQSVVGDNPERLAEALALAFSRADFVITTGGLGPTKDDLTKETAAASMGVRLALHEPSLAHIEEYFRSTGREVTETVRKQAYLPQGSQALFNSVGTAPGFWLEKDGKILAMLPGPPREMKAMFSSGIAPRLAAGKGIFSHRVMVMEMGESAVAEALSDLLDGASPTVATYAKDVQTEVRVTVAAESREQAEAVLAPAVKEICARLGEYVYDIDSPDIAHTVVRLLRERGENAAFAESCTGGLIAKMVTDVPGASAVFGFGAVTYANEAKEKMLGVKSETLARFGAVSEQTAMEMAEGVRRLSGADYGISVTGIAGPDGGSEEKPVGLVYIGVSRAGENFALRYCLGGKTRGREVIRLLAATRALNLLRKTILK